MSAPVAVEWAGPEDERIIASETNPWLRIDGFGAANLLTLATDGTIPLDGACGGCYAGAIPAMDSPTGVQRCDECDLLPGDLEAAEVLAVLLRPTLGPLTVMFYTDEAAS